MMKSIIVLICFFGLLHAHGQTTIILVRHAEKAATPGKDPELSSEGRERAEELARVLSAVKIDQIFSTSFKRTRETVDPLATHLQLDVQEYDPSSLTRLSETLKRSPRQTTILVVGHSNTTPALVNLLIGERKYEELAESAYDNLYIVTIWEGDAAAVILKYGKASH